MESKKIRKNKKFKSKPLPHNDEKLNSIDSQQHKICWNNTFASAINVLAVWQTLTFTEKEQMINLLRFHLTQKFGKVLKKKINTRVRRHSSCNVQLCMAKTKSFKSDVSTAKFPLTAMWRLLMMDGGKPKICHINMAMHPMDETWRIIAASQKPQFPMRIVNCSESELLYQTIQINENYTVNLLWQEF